MKLNYKFVCWLIWLTGLLSIGVTIFFNKTFLSGFSGNFLFATFLSSIPFGVLALYTKGVYENEELKHSKKNKLAGILGAFVLTFIYAIWSHAVSMKNAFNPASFFWILSFGTMIIGYVFGGAVHNMFFKGR